MALKSGLKFVVERLNKKYNLGVPKEMEPAISSALEFAGYSPEDDAADLKDAIVSLKKRKQKIMENPLSVPSKNKKSFCPICGNNEEHAALVSLKESRKANYCKLHKTVLPLPVE